MNNAMTISITCKDEATKARFLTLASKMEADEEFKAALKQCKSEESVYDLYKQNEYTDLSFETFKTEFKELINGIIKSQPAETFELSEDELENVVGGSFELFRFFTAAVSAIPVAGPLIAGVARGIKAGIEGKDASEITKQVFVGVGLALVDAAVMVATMGAGSFATTAMKAGLTGMSFVKAGFNEALKS